MKNLLIYILLVIAVACNDSKNKKEDVEDKKPYISTKPDSLIIDTVKQKKVNKDTALLVLRKEVLTAIKNNDYNKFVTFIHPEQGVRFSQYGNVNIKTDIKFTGVDFLNKIKEKRTKINWGNYDGSGDAILLTIEEYFKKFIYAADFLNAEKVSINQKNGKGNSINNIVEIYKPCDFVESHFTGFDKSLGGMDWQSLRLVFKKYNDKYYLVGVVHDQWTI
jgi:hypothetical protein